jgi:hypothetical protein
MRQTSSGDDGRWPDPDELHEGFVTERRGEQDRLVAAGMTVAEVDRMDLRAPAASGCRRFLRSILLPMSLTVIPSWWSPPHPGSSLRECSQLLQI